MKTSPLLLAIALLTACGSADDEGLDDSASTSKNCTRREVRWLHEDNFWRVAWSDVARSGNRADTGTYEMRLGKSYTSGSYTLYPLQISGDSEDVAPRYQAIGANACGDIVGFRGKDIISIYDADVQTWTGNGFWGPVARSKSQRVSKTLPSVIMEPSTYLKPPFIAVGVATNVSTPGSEGGCKFYHEVGQTICTEGDAGTTFSTATVEYWSDEMGPVVYQDSAFYGGGDLRNREKRIEVYYFGGNAEPGVQNHVGTNAIADALPLQLNSELSVQVVVLPEGNAGDATAAGTGIPAQAVGVENWFSLDVTSALARKSLLVFLSWTNDADYELLVFTAPDSEYGFRYVTRGDAVSAADIEASGLDISGAVNCSGEYAATRYLLGVRRLKHGTGDDGYSLVTQAD